jgi:hypothetical protein
VPLQPSAPIAWVVLLGGFGKAREVVEGFIPPIRELPPIPAAALADQQSVDEEGARDPPEASAPGAPVYGQRKRPRVRVARAPLRAVSLAAAEEILPASSHLPERSRAGGLGGEIGLGRRRTARGTPFQPRRRAISAAPAMAIAIASRPGRPRTGTSRGEGLGPIRRTLSNQQVAGAAVGATLRCSRSTRRKAKPVEWSPSMCSQTPVPLDPEFVEPVGLVQATSL